MIADYLKNTKGNFSITFAFMATVLLMGVAVAVDISSAVGQRSKLQDLADAAVLAAASSGEQEEDELQLIAEDSVDANDFTGLSLETELKILENNALNVTVSTSVKPFLMGIFGKKALDIAAVAEAPPKGSSPMNVALVLDSTKSMEGAKLAALQDAANDFVDTFDDGLDNMRISVVPFAEYVRLPLTYSTAPWINVAPPGNECWTTIDEDNSTNCRQEGTGEDEHTVCDVTVTQEVCEWKEWDGCVGSRLEPLNAAVDYGMDPMQGFTVGTWCHSTMQPLTSNFTDIRTAIDGMNPWQQTYMPAGLIWGWRTLTPEAPLSEADTDDKDERRSSMILMSDGENTRSIAEAPANDFEGRYHWGEDVDAANALTASLCESIKADGITIYTIAFEVPDSATRALLRNCASSPSLAYSSNNAAQLKRAFENIGEKLAQVRLSK